MRNDILFEFRNDSGFIVLQQDGIGNFVLSGKPEFQRRNLGKYGTFCLEYGCFSRKHLTFLHGSN